MSEDVNEQVDEEIYELEGTEIFSDLEQAVAIMYWLLHINGGKVVFPVDEEFWLTHYPKDARLVLRKEDGQLVLVAEEKVWQTADPRLSDRG